MPEKSEPLIERIKLALRDFYAKPVEQRVAERFPDAEERGRPLMDRIESLKGAITTHIDEPVAKRMHGGGRMAKWLAEAYGLPEPSQRSVNLDEDK